MPWQPKLKYCTKSGSRNTVRVSNSWIQIQNVRPDLGPNCLQRLSADDKSPLARKELWTDRAKPSPTLIHPVALRVAKTTWHFAQAEFEGIIFYNLIRYETGSEGMASV